MKGSTSGSWNGQAFSLTFVGTGDRRFLITPTSFDFGVVHVGSHTPQQAVTVTNEGSTSVVMSGAGGGAGVFGGVQDCQGQTLAPGGSCHMYYQFSPTTTGTVNGSTSGSWNGQSFSLRFTGIGAPQFNISPVSLNFGRVPVGTTGPTQVVLITNLGTSSVVMSGSGGGAGVFGGVQDCQGQTLAPGTSCHMSYAFTPTAKGKVTGGTSGTWNGQSFSLSFVGTGT